MANDLGFTEVTVAAMLGHSRGTVTSRYIHVIDTALIMAADSVCGYIQGLLDDVKITRQSHVLDRESRKTAVGRFLGQAGGQPLRRRRAADEGKAISVPRSLGADVLKAPRTE